MKGAHSVCELCGAMIPDSGSLFCETCANDPAQLELVMIQSFRGDDRMNKIKGYKEIKSLGKGGMGAVWLVEEMATGAQMALKLILPKVASDENKKAWFLREGRNGCQLRHPNIVQYHKFERSGDIFYILMEYCPGGNVEDLIKRNRDIFREDTEKMKERIEISTAIVLQALDGLIYAHQAPVTSLLADGSEQSVTGIVHRDFNPGNIFLSDTSLTPTAKVADFGLAKAFQSAGLTNDTFTGMYAGNPIFIPRQQIIEYRYAKPDVDVWAAAATYYYMLTGYAPKDFKGRIDRFAAALDAEPVPVQVRNPHVPDRLAEVIDTALRETPEIGFATVKALKEAIVSA